MCVCVCVYLYIYVHTEVGGAGGMIHVPLATSDIATPERSTSFRNSQALKRSASRHAESKCWGSALTR